MSEIKTKSLRDDEKRIPRRMETKWHKYAVDRKMIEYGKAEPKEKSVPADPNPNFSHTLLAGGNLNVPIEDYLDFLMLLADDVSAGYIPDLNEISPPLNRLYMDLDFKDKFAPGGHQLYSNRHVREYTEGTGSPKMPAIIVEEEGLERLRYSNIAVAVCVAAKVAEYFPALPADAIQFHTHCLWRPSRFKYETREYVNAAGRYVEEKIVVERSSGIHLIWPKLYVTHAQALDIREGVIRALGAKFTKPANVNCRNVPGTNPWQEIVDEKIYLPLQSLRMVLSDKYNTCKECEERNLRVHGTKKLPAKKRKVDTPPSSLTVQDVVERNPFDNRKAHCSCHGLGKVAANSIYEYKATINGEYCDVTQVYEKRFTEKVYLMLCACCIRDPERIDLIREKKLRPTDPVFKLPEDAPRYKGFKPSSEVSLQQNGQDHESYKDKIEKSISRSRLFLGSKTDEELSVGSKEFNAVQSIFSNSVSIVNQAKIAVGERTPVLNLAVYKSVAVHRLRRHCIDGTFYYLVEITDTGQTNDSKYCFNVNREHKCEQNVFFKITAKHGIVQKCNCYSINNKPSCRSFTSAPCLLPPTVQSVLFSNDLITRGLNMKQENILATSRRKRSLLEMTKEAKDAEIEKSFRAITLDEKDAKKLIEYALTKQKSNISPEDQQASSSSPHDPEESAKDKIYRDLQQEKKLFRIDSIESNSNEMQSEQNEPAEQDVHEIIARLTKENSKMMHDKKSIYDKLVGCFNDTCSPAYHMETNKE